MSIPTQRDFYARFPNELSVQQFLHDNQVFYESYNCSECNSVMKKYRNPDSFTCTKRSCSKCRTRISARVGTFFYGTRLQCIEILNLAHLWLCEIPVKSCITYTGHSPNTICAYYKYFRQLVSSAVSEESQIIGGDNIVVEIDETKLGKRKYNRGHRVDGVWVIVGIERQTDGNIFLVPVQDRSAVTLRRIIDMHVRPGSIIHTDMWRGYSDLESLGMSHITVNHSQSFFDPVFGGCTNHAEGLNSGLKRKIPVRNRVEEGIDSHLLEYIWRRQNKSTLFDAFITALRDVHFELN